MDAPPLDELSARLGIVPREPELIRQAFVHSSYFNENPTLAAGHNERLEFYGDAVIGVAVSRLLFERYPDEDEGFLTARRAALVNREALAVMALSIGLDRYLLLGRGETEAGGATRPSVLAACFEALAGAISLSEGHRAAEAVLERVFGPQLDALAAVPGPPKSAKSLPPGVDPAPPWREAQLPGRRHHRPATRPALPGHCGGRRRGAGGRVPDRAGSAQRSRPPRRRCWSSLTSPATPCSRPFREPSQGAAPPRLQVVCGSDQVRLRAGRERRHRPERLREEQHG